VYVLDEQPYLQLERFDDGSTAATVAEGDAPFNASQTLRAWLISHAFEATYTSVPTALSARVQELAADVGVPALADLIADIP
jgi:hypothetical protein